MKIQTLITQLNDDIPFDEWKYEIEQALLAHGLIDAIEETTTNDNDIDLLDKDNNNKELRQQKAKAFSIIMSGLNDKDKATFRKHKDVVKAWKNLVNTYRFQETTKLLSLETEIMEFKLTDITKDISNLTMIVESFRSLGGKVSDTFLSHKVLKQLPDSFLELEVSIRSDPQFKTNDEYDFLKYARQ